MARFAKCKNKRTLSKALKSQQHQHLLRMDCMAHHLSITYHWPVRPFIREIEVLILILHPTCVHYL